MGVSFGELEAREPSARELSEAFWKQEVNEVAVGSTHEEQGLLGAALLSGAGLFLSVAGSSRWRCGDRMG